MKTLYFNPVKYQKRGRSAIYGKQTKALNY